MAQQCFCFCFKLHHKGNIISGFMALHVLILGKKKKKIDSNDNQYQEPHKHKMDKRMQTPAWQQGSQRPVGTLWAANPKPLKIWSRSSQRIMKSLGKVGQRNLGRREFQVKQEEHWNGSCNLTRSGLAVTGTLNRTVSEQSGCRHVVS